MERHLKHIENIGHDGPDDAECAEDAIAVQDRATLPPGHPVSWGALVAGTCLAGIAYPRFSPARPAVAEWGDRA